MKKLVTMIVCLCSLTLLYGQEKNFDDLMKQGIALHDKGEYEAAIECYRQALELSKESSIANYEIAMSYSAMKNYKEAIEYAKKALELDDSSIHAYIILGNALDDSGKRDEAIGVYETAFDKGLQHYMLYFNYALSLLRAGRFAESEQAATEAIKFKPSHTSSHIVLSSAMRAQDKKIPAALAMYFSLMLEPNSPRAAQNLQELRGILTGNVQTEDGKSINIAVSPLEDADDDLSAMELALAMSEAMRYLPTEEFTPMSETGYLVQSTKVLFELLDDMEIKPEFWREFYAPFFVSIDQNKATEAFVYYISMSNDAPDVREWLKDNDDKVDEMIKIANENLPF